MTAILDAIRESTAKRAVSGLVKIGHALRSRSWSEGEKQGLTPTQGQVLSLMAGARGPVRPSLLAEMLQVSRPTLSDALAALARKGLIAREGDPDDRRAVALMLTDQGRAVADRVAGWPDFLACAIGDLPQPLQGALLRGLIGTIRNLQERGDIPVQRLCVTCRHFRPNVHANAGAPHHCAFVDVAFGDHHLRLDCAEQETAPARERQVLWSAFLGGFATVEPRSAPRSRQGSRNVYGARHRRADDGSGAPTSPPGR